MPKPRKNPLAMKNQKPTDGRKNNSRKKNTNKSDKKGNRKFKIGI